jgi:hypothetical protein
MRKYLFPQTSNLKFMDKKRLSLISRIHRTFHFWGVPRNALNIHR